ncbi:MAG TPA: ATP-dependent Clp protease proteolytic subunit [Anaerolineae bacterium]|nr:ATP-dependent Clp protease proteolytic subunit [Anaerolineae bacterium]HQK14003.1 ATP-dependent Clp protease proteolytic subunit [Anaerolineae bacterium]
MNDEETPMFPYVIEDTRLGERIYDIYSVLLRERIIFLGTPINALVANEVVAKLLFLDREDSEREISLYINSPGGEISAGLAIYDTMQLIQAPVSTIAVGMTASMATVLLAAGTKGRRYALPHATIHLHQPLGGVQGQATDIEIAAKEILRMRELLNNLLRKHTGLDDAQIERFTDRDFYMTAQQGVEYRLIDKVLEPSNNK